jgi:hypothetical protein
MLMGSHSGENLANSLLSTLTENGPENKIASITTDNAGNCDIISSFEGTPWFQSKRSID